MYRLVEWSIIAFACSRVVAASVVPHDTIIYPNRGFASVTIDGDFIIRSNVLSLSSLSFTEGVDFHRIPMRPEVQASGCGNSTIQNEYFFVPAATPNDVFLDVSDMVRGSDRRLYSICLSFESSLSRTLDSVIYLVRPHTENQILILNPSNVAQYALDGIISYAPVGPGSRLVARVGFEASSEHQQIFSTTRDVVIDQLGYYATGIPRDQLEHIQNIIRSTNGLTLRSSNHAFGYNCYHRLLSLLPTLYFRLLSLDGTEVVADIVFTPEDYLQDSPSSPDHAFLSLYAVDDASPVMLSGELLSKLGGFHFDYTNNRIGFFDINMFDDM